MGNATRQAAEDLKLMAVPLPGSTRHGYNNNIYCNYSPAGSTFEGPTNRN